MVQYELISSSCFLTDKIMQQRRQSSGSGSLLSFNMSQYELKDKMSHQAERGHPSYRPTRLSTMCCIAKNKLNKLKTSKIMMFFVLSSNFLITLNS